MGSFPRALAISLWLVACGSDVVQNERSPEHSESKAPTDHPSSQSSKKERNASGDVPTIAASRPGSSATAAASSSVDPRPGPETGSKPSSGSDSKPGYSLIVAAKEFLLPHRTQTTPLKRLWATFYHTLRFESAESGYALLTLSGIPLGPKLSKLQWCQAAMEGSVQIQLNSVWKTYKYAGTAGTVQVDCTEYFDHPVGRTRFTVARGPYGDGVRNYILVPFRTIAVDPEVIPYGSAIFIPAARGLKFVLSDGTERIHDGYFFAADTGGLIHGDHIDVFIGNALRSPFPWITSNSKSKTGYHIVDDPDLRDVFTSLHTLSSEL